MKNKISIDTVIDGMVSPLCQHEIEIFISLCIQLNAYAYVFYVIFSIFRYKEFKTRNISGSTVLQRFLNYVNELLR